MIANLSLEIKILIVLLEMISFLLFCPFLDVPAQTLIEAY